MEDIRNFCPLWGEWEAEEKLGEGSFGAVWKMRREGYGGQTYYSAVKHISIPKDESEIRNLMDEGILESQDSSVRYYNKVLDSLVGEIDTMHQLQGYTNIVSYEDHKIIPKKSGVGYDLFLRMELLTPLTKRIREQMTVTDVIKLGCDIAEAISILNKFHMVHRDIKPQNIFVNNTGDYKLGDYGTARALNSEATAMSRKGTFNYMAPEIYNNQAADIRVDIYSLGIVLYRLLNGNRLPFLPTTGEVTNRMNEEAQVRRLSGEDLPAPAYANENLANVVLKACAFDPKDRYQSAEEMKRDLQLCLEERNRSLGENSIEQNPSEPLQFKFTRTNTGADSFRSGLSNSGSGQSARLEQSASGDIRLEPEPSVTRPITPFPDMPRAQQSMPSRTETSSPEKKKFGARGIALLIALVAVIAGALLLINGLRKNENGRNDNRTQTETNVEQKTETTAKGTDTEKAGSELTITSEPSQNEETAQPAAQTEEPTPNPTVAPTPSPTDTPTDSPTATPTVIPTDTPTTAPTDTPEPKKPHGDVNGDGILDTADAELLGRFVSGWNVKLDEAEADVNGDGTVDLSDVVRLHKDLQGK
jgi:serine/threonine-protein kinase